MEHVSTGQALPGGFRTCAFGRTSFGNDVELVRAVRGSDRTAASELVRRYEGHVTAVLRRIIGSDPEIPDLIQETFLRALRRLDNLKEPQALKAWLGRVAVFTALDYTRSRGRLSWLEVVPPDQLELQDEPGAPELRQRVTFLVESLPRDEQEAFRLRFVVGMEHKELAEALECSLATVKRRLGHARSRFVALAQRDPMLRNYWQ